MIEELATKLAQRADATTVIRDAEAALHGAADAAEEPPAAVEEDLKLHERDPDDPSNICG